MAWSKPQKMTQICGIPISPLDSLYNRETLSLRLYYIYIHMYICIYTYMYIHPVLSRSSRASCFYADFHASSNPLKLLQILVFLGFFVASKPSNPLKLLQNLQISVFLTKCWFKFPKTTAGGNSSLLKRLPPYAKWLGGLFTFQVPNPGRCCGENQRNIRGLTINGIGCNHLWIC
jgi:hypothetical protein